MKVTNKMKIAILGEGRVGKSSIIERYIKNTFDPEKNQSKSASNFVKILTSPDKKMELRVEIWDTAGQEMFRSIAPMYYKDADAILFVYSIVNLQSFKALGYWVGEVKAEDKPYVLAFAGNMADIVNGQSVPTEDGENFAQEKGGIFMLTSAKEDINITKIFNAMIEKKFPMIFKQQQPEPEKKPKPEAKNVPIPSNAPTVEEEKKERIGQSIRLKNQPKTNTKQKCCGP